MAQDIGGFVTAVTFDGTDLVPPSHSYVLWIAQGLNAVPTVRGKDSLIARAAGRTPRSRVADTLSIEIVGWVLAQGTTLALAVADYRASIEALKALFDPALDPRVLQATLEDGTTATINARAVPPLLITENVPSHVARVSAALESVDPYWVIT